MTLERTAEQHKRLRVDTQLTRRLDGRGRCSDDRATPRFNLSNLRWAGFGAGLAAGAAIVVVVGWMAGRDATPLQDDPGIPPPEYLYLDNARVLAYLAQIEGGLSAGEKRSRSLTEESSASVSAGGVGAGGSRKAEDFVEETVTPTTTSRFYRLLDRLRAKGYLHDVDLSSSRAGAAQELARAPEGSFVRLENCALRLPTYIQMLKLIRASGGRIAAARAYENAFGGSPAAIDAVAKAWNAAHPQGPPMLPYPPYIDATPGRGKRLAQAATAFARGVARRPRIPLGSCGGSEPARRGGLDFLFPLSLAALSSEESLLSGRVNVLGKLIRNVRTQGDAYVDSNLLSTFLAPITALHDALLRDPPRGYTDDPGLLEELYADVTVLPPGGLIIPVAIYK
jgi:hypothetical protein